MFADQIQYAIAILRRLGMINGLGDVAIFLKPVAGTQVEFSHLVWGLHCKQAPQKFAEKGMISIPLTSLIKSNRKKVCPLQLLENGLSLSGRAPTKYHGLAERSGEAHQDRGL